MEEFTLKNTERILERHKSWNMTDALQIPEISQILS
nr:MAG TPA: hypothetical protein [Caudoviricetes sp.]